VIISSNVGDVRVILVTSSVSNLKSLNMFFLNSSFYGKLCIKFPSIHKPNYSFVRSRESRISVISVTAAPRTGRSGVRIPVIYKRFLFFPKLPDRLWGQSRFPFEGYQGFFSGVKGPAREINH